MRLPAHIIGIGFITGNRDLLFSKLRLAGFRVHTGPYVTVGSLVSALEARKGDCKPRWRDLDIVDYESIYTVPNAEPLEFTTLLTGYWDASGVMALASDIRLAMLMVSPEERAWLESHGFKPDGPCWQRGGIRLIPTTTPKVDAAYLRDWHVDEVTHPRASTLTHHPINAPIHKVCAWLYTRPGTRQHLAVEDPLVFLAGVVPPEDRAWLDANGFTPEFTYDVTFEKKVWGLNLRLTFNALLNDWSAYGTHEGAFPRSIGDEEFVPGNMRVDEVPTAASAYKALLEAGAERLRGCREVVESKRAAVATDLVNLEDFANALASIQEE